MEHVGVSNESDLASHTVTACLGPNGRSFTGPKAPRAWHPILAPRARSRGCRGTGGTSRPYAVLWDRPRAPGLRSSLPKAVSGTLRRLLRGPSLSRGGPVSGHA